MTFDDGILTVYGMKNTAEQGDMPKETPVLQSQHYFCYDTLGFQRYYTALQAKQQIDAVVNIPLWQDIRMTDMVVLDDGSSFGVRLVQKMKDDNGLQITKLTLERLENVDVTDQSNQRSITKC